MHKTPSLKWAVFAIVLVVLLSVSTGVYIIFHVSKITNKVVLGYLSGLFIAAIIIYKILMLSSERYLISNGIKLPKREHDSWMPAIRKAKTRSDEDGEELY